MKSMKEPMSDMQKAMQMRQGLGLVMTAVLGLLYLHLGQSGYLNQLDQHTLIPMFISVLWILKMIFQYFSPPIPTVPAADTASTDRAADTAADTKKAAKRATPSKKTD